MNPELEINRFKRRERRDAENAEKSIAKCSLGNTSRFLCALCVSASSASKEFSTEGTK